MTTQAPLTRRDWLPAIIQMVGLIAGAFIFSQSIEHRITMAEEQIKMHGQLIQEMQATERLLAEQIRLSERTLERLVTLEDFFHGMSPDEAEGFMRRKGRK